MSKRCQELGGFPQHRGLFRYASHVCHMYRMKQVSLLRASCTRSTNVKNKKLNDYGGLTNIALGGFHAYV